MPEFTLASLGGESFCKADFAGKVVLFDFWATWCGPCHLQAEILAQIYPEAAKRGIEFVAVSTGEDASTVRDFVARKPFLYAVLVDPEDLMGGKLEIIALPTLVVMDAQGQIAYRHTGVADAEAIDAALRVAEASGRRLIPLGATLSPRTLRAAAPGAPKEGSVDALDGGPRTPCRGLSPASAQAAVALSAPGAGGLQLAAAQHAGKSRLHPRHCGAQSASARPQPGRARADRSCTSSVTWRPARAPATDRSGRR